MKTSARSSSPKVNGAFHWSGSFPVFCLFISFPQLVLMAHNINRQRETKVNSLASPSTWGPVAPAADPGERELAGRPGWASRAPHTSPFLMGDGSASLALVSVKLPHINISANSLKEISLLLSLALAPSLSFCSSGEPSVTQMALRRQELKH